MGVPALILAAGSGQRLGAGQPKALVPLAGRPLYAWSVDAFRQAPSVDRVVLLVPPGQGDRYTEPGIEIIEGGDVRSASVSNGLDHLASAAKDGAVPEVVVVHDAARPLVTPELIELAIGALESAPELDGVIVAAPVTDTIKRVSGDRVLETLDRAELVSVETPQVFRLAALRRAIRSGDLAGATDDAALVESSGGSVGIVASPSANMKVTVPGDLEIAAGLLERMR